MSEIAVERVSITTTGGAGAATGSGTTIPINGFLLDVYINYNAACPATADVTIADAVFGNALVVSNNATDGWYAPRKATCDPAAAATGLYDLIPLNGALTLSVAQADALTACVVVDIRWITP
ncbi:MAG: hypothetical protein A2Z71_03320 [Chloroflexi bacterium RBG_13_50_21]|nr:MAG: hypothetical protein A2Z71_03320 [Chloroflexi bacterium RBG_13_50_21]